MVLVEWFQAQDSDWPAGITQVSMDAIADNVLPAPLALPPAAVIVDPFHLVALGNKASPSCRRELAWAQPPGRRGASRIGGGCNAAGCCAAETLTDDEMAAGRDAIAPGRPVHDPSGGLVEHKQCHIGRCNQPKAN